MAGAQQPFDPEQAIRRLFEAGQNIKLGSGVVSKTGRAALGLIGLWGFIVWRLSPNLWLDAILVAVGIIATLGFAWWVQATHGFAERNPAQAMLEGAQFVEYAKVTSEIKGGATASGGSALLEGPPVIPLIGGDD